MISRDVLGWLEGCLWPKGARRDAWMIVDAARDPRIYGLLLNDFYSERICLFKGEVAPELQVAAPYLVQLEYDDDKTRHFLSQAWGNHWGIFLKCDTSLKRLRDHLSDLLVVHDESGSQLVFRYYDPRVLRVYLPTCTADELNSVFGPIERFLLEAELPDRLLEFRMVNQQLVTKRLSISEEVAKGMASGG